MIGLYMISFFFLLIHNLEAGIIFSKPPKIDRNTHAEQIPADIYREKIYPFLNNQDLTKLSETCTSFKHETFRNRCENIIETYRSVFGSEALNIKLKLFSQHDQINYNGLLNNLSKLIYENFNSIEPVKLNETAEELYKCIQKSIPRETELKLFQLSVSNPLVQELMAKRCSGLTKLNSMTKLDFDVIFESAWKPQCELYLYDTNQLYKPWDQFNVTDKAKILHEFCFQPYWKTPNFRAIVRASIGENECDIVPVYKEINRIYIESQNDDNSWFWVFFQPAWKVCTKFINANAQLTFKPFYSS